MEKQPDGTLRAVACCAVCGQTLGSSKTLTEAQFDEIGRRHVQDVLPDWSPAERELFFLSGICGSCWDDMFNDKEVPNDET